MQGLQRFVCTAVLIAGSAAPAWAIGLQPDSSGFDEPLPPHNVLIAKRTAAHISAFSVKGLPFRVREINVPGASFIKLHFSHFNLPEGIEVEITNPDGSEMWLYAHDERREITVDADIGDDGVNSFSAMSVTGDTVIVRLTGDLSLFDPSEHRLEIDSWLEGLPLGQSRVLDKIIGKKESDDSSQPQNSCGFDERYDRRTKACFD